MRQALIQNTGAISTGTAADPTLGAVGVINAFTVNRANAINPLNLGAAGETLATVPTGDAFMFTINRGGGVIERTNLLYPEKIKKVTKKLYAAPAPHVQTLTLSGPATDSGEVTLRFQDTFPGVEPYDKWNYSVKVTSGETATAVATKLEAAINAAVSDQHPFTVSRAAAVLTITASKVETFLKGGFAPGYMDGTSNTGITAVFATSAFSVGSGSPSQIRDITQYHPANLGRYYQEDNILGAQADIADYVDGGGQYHMYCVLHETPFDLAINKSVQFEEITLCIEDSVTGTIDEFFGSKLVS